MRNIIYEKKNTYLTIGHRKDSKGIRNADSRMAYDADLKEFADILVNWAVTDRNVFALYTQLRDLNKSKGYELSDLEK